MPQILPFCKIDRFEIYGDPGPEVAAMAGGFGAWILSYFAGICR